MWVSRSCTLPFTPCGRRQRGRKSATDEGFVSADSELTDTERAERNPSSGAEDGAERRSGCATFSHKGRRKKVRELAFMAYVA